MYFLYSIHKILFCFIFPKNQTFSFFIYFFLFYIIIIYNIIINGSGFSEPPLRVFLNPLQKFLNPLKITLFFPLQTFNTSSQKISFVCALFCSLLHFVCCLCIIYLKIHKIQCRAFKTPLKEHFLKTSLNLSFKKHISKHFYFINKNFPKKQ